MRKAFGVARHLKGPVEPGRLLCNLSVVVCVFAAQEDDADRAELEGVPVPLPVPSLPGDVKAVAHPRSISRRAWAKQKHKTPKRSASTHDAIRQRGHGCIVIRE